MFEIIKEKMREYIKNERLEDSQIRDDEMEDRILFVFKRIISLTKNKILKNFILS
jgi:hypothetical protein